VADKDKYGIPPGGNNGAYSVKYWQGIHYTLPWKELMASIALAGWPQEKWGMAAAIAAAESSRNPAVYNTFKKGHFGLFQISRSAWPEFFSSGGGGEMQWVSPVKNAEQAHKIYKESGFKAWEAYSGGRYLSYYPVALEQAANLERMTGSHHGDEKAYWQSLISQKTSAVVMKGMQISAADLGKAFGTALGDAIGDAADATAQGTVASGDAVASSVNATFGWLPDLWTTLTTPAIWMRFAYGITGIVLVGGGLFLIVRKSPTVQKTAKAVARAVPAGAAVKAAKGAS
jgi:hypothetical protein